MNSRERSITLRTVLATLAIVVLLHGVAIFVYALRVRSAAQTLIHLAQEIRTIDDAGELASTWEQTSIQSVTGEISKTSRMYDFTVSSGLLTTFHLLPSTGMRLQVSAEHGRRVRVVLAMYTDRASVLVQDYASAERSYVYIGDDEDGIAKAVFSLGPEVSAATKKSAFTFNENCFLRLGGCRSATQMLPSLSELRNQISKAQPSPSALR